MNFSIRRLAVGTAFATAIAWGITPASAQSEPSVTEPTETQRSYNERGVEHMFAGEYAQAAASFRSSLALGASNIAWLNYGRALQKLGRCDESRRAFDNVETAPVVVAPTPRELAAVLSNFRTEWNAQCTGELAFVCPEEPVSLRIDGGELRQCDPAPIPVTPGRHVITVPAWSATFEADVGDELAVLQIAAPPSDDDADVPGPVDATDGQVSKTEIQPPANDEDAQRWGARRTAGFVIAATGLAALGASLAMEIAWVSPAYEDYRTASTGAEWDERRATVRTAQRTNRAVFFSGIALAAVGATLFVIPGPRATEVAVRTSAAMPLTLEIVW